MNNENLKGFGVGILVGLVIGGAVALLYAPKSGKELRSDIKVKAKKVASDVRAKLNIATVDDLKC